MSSSAIKTFILPAAITLLAFFFAFQFVDPAPPKSVTITTGQKNGSYYSFAKQYQTILAKHNIELIIQESNGSVDNLTRIIDNKADIGFIQGGVATDYNGTDLLTLGNLYYEPLWLFHKSELSITTFKDLVDKKIYIGEPGSGTKALVEQLLNDNQLSDKVETVNLKSAEVAFFVAAADSEVIRDYLEDEAYSLLSFERAQAYERRMKFLTHVTLPRGLVDLSKDIPSQDKTMLASTANLVVNANLHPAIQDLLLQSMEDVHQKGGWFENSSEFPNSNFSELPVSPEAKRFYKHGPPLLQRYLPFWLASLIDRLKVMLLPLVLMMLPLMKIMPPVYTWRMRSKIYRWYQSLEQIELAFSKEEHDKIALKEQLDILEQEVIQVEVPLSFASQLYDLRQHIELVKRRLD